MSFDAALPKARFRNLSYLCNIVYDTVFLSWGTLMLKGMRRGFAVMRTGILAAHYSTHRGNSSAIDKLRLALLKKDKDNFRTIVQTTENFSDDELGQACYLAIELGEEEGLLNLLKKLDNSLLHGDFLNYAITCNQQKIVLTLLYFSDLELEDITNALVHAISCRSTISLSHVLKVVENDLESKEPPISEESKKHYAQTVNALFVKCAEIPLYLALSYFVGFKLIKALLNKVSIGEALNNASIKGNLDVLKLILAQGFNIDASYFEVAIRNARQKKHLDVANLLDSIINPVPPTSQLPIKMPIYVGTFYQGTRPLLYVSERHRFGSPGWLKEREEVMDMLEKQFSKASLEEPKATKNKK